MPDLTVTLTDIVDPIFSATLPDEAKTKLVADPFDIMEKVEGILSTPPPKHDINDSSTPPAIPQGMLSIICDAMRKAWGHPELKAHWCLQLWVALNDQIANLEIVKKCKAIANPEDAKP
jgi:hypothetical protein